MRNPQVPQIANRLREEGFDVFDDWYSAGPEADDKWKEYERGRGHDYIEALQGYAAEHVFDFDQYHLRRCDLGVLVLPAGRSCHLEMGFLAGMGKPTFILLDQDYDRWDVMYRFADGIFWNVEDLCRHLRLMNIRP